MVRKITIQNQSIRALKTNEKKYMNKNKKVITNCNTYITAIVKIIKKT